MNDELIFNGIDAETGHYLTDSLPLARLAHLALGTSVPDALRRELDARQLAGFPVRRGVDANDLSQSGWAVVFAHAPDGSPAAQQQSAIREALGPLLEHRRAQAGQRYREVGGEQGWRPGESKRQFLTRMGTATAGPVDPERFPYYVLLVGSPEELSYRQQYELDVQYGVGRIHFDTPDEYAAYAANVVAAETEGNGRAATAGFFAPDNIGDAATYASSHLLVAPLAEQVHESLAPGSDWRVETWLGNAAKKARLADLLNHRAPAFLFTAGHGIGFRRDDPKQHACQGALLCQDWPGSGALCEDHYVAAHDIADTADLRGMVSFHFACYGMGTPRHDNFAQRLAGHDAPPELASRAFVAELPRRLLGHRRGALACIGHVDRAWSSSFLDAGVAGGVEPFIDTFLSTVQGLLDGVRVGLAIDGFNLRYAELTSELATVIEGIRKYDDSVDERELSRLWIYANDARNYAVVGDPAVRIAGAAATRLGMDVQESTPGHAGRHPEEGTPGAQETL